MTTHNKRREEDEYVCPRCGKRWGVNEEPPKCEEKVSG